MNYLVETGWLRAECDATQAAWYRDHFGQTVQTPYHGHAVVRGVDSDESGKQYVTLQRVPSAADGFAPGCSPD